MRVGKSRRKIPYRVKLRSRESRRKFLIESNCGLKRTNVVKRPEINAERKKLREEKEKYSKRNPLNAKMREDKAKQRNTQ